MLEARFKAESERLSEEIQLARESRAKLRTVSVGSSTGLSFSNNSSTVDSLEVSREEEDGEVKGEDEEEEEDGENGGEGEGEGEREAGGEEDSATEEEINEDEQ